ncbi:MAG TPA: aminomethyl-transferring glycine dehydrogenase subunit GcvPA [Chloroflexi bacterium]|nr:aminomethyl-transferring glycine dehydrogenase subunit GcvPA [Chloroflexota bacterium]
MTYTPNTEADRSVMLRAIGASGIDELFIDIPDRWRNPFIDLPDPLPEVDVVRHLAEIAGANQTLQDAPSFLGAGFYRHFVPALVDQQLLRSEWYTAYTPYQPEMAQGTLQAMYEFQSLVCALTGMEVSNASLYDGASALAEAVLLCRTVTRRSGVVLADSVHPVYRQVVETYTRPLDVNLNVPQSFSRSGTALVPDVQPVIDAIDGDTACVVVQRPDFLGMIESVDPVVEAARAHGARVVVVVGDPVSLGLLTPPGELGADIVVGELRSLAGAPAYGGPGAGMFATTEELIRRVPGRIAGRTLDLDGQQGFVLTLQTREQHIRRERATSNITTNEALVALGATMSVSALGPRGLREVASQCVSAAHRTAEALSNVGAEIGSAGAFFNEFVVHAPPNAHDNLEHLRVQAGVLAGVDLGQFFPHLKDMVLMAATELTTAEEVRGLADAWRRHFNG